MSGKNYCVCMLWMGGILLFISSIHRIVFAYSDGKIYVNELFVSAIMIPFVLFALLIIMYIPLLIFSALKIKKSNGLYIISYY